MTRSPRSAAVPLPASTQVLISGAGPVGLAAAVELGRSGVSCLVVEPRPTVSRTRPRCKTINVRTMEHLRRWGVADRVRAAAPLAPGWSQDVVFCTSLTGRALSRFSGVFGLSARPDRSAEVGQQAPQYVVEEVLRDVVGELPACTLALGARVLGLEQTDATVRVEVETADGRSVVDAEYVIGCDGSRSAVRSAIGAAYVGEVAPRPSFGTVFRAPQLSEHVAHGRAIQYWLLNDDVPGSMGPLNGRDLWWANFLGVDRERGEREILRLIATAIGREVEVEIVSTDPWTSHMELADTTRRGRVFLAGDAAHLNPPWGGHGMNTGFGDAVDLGWKLAAVLQGWGGPILLDSYERERRPVAMRIIAEAEANMRVLSDDLQSEHIDDDGPTGDEARRRLDDRIQQTKTREFHSLELILGLGYDDSPVVVSAPAATADPDGVPVTPGYRLPHAWAAPGIPVFDRLGTGLTLLYREEHEADAARVEAACRRRAVPLTLLDVTPLHLDRPYEPGMVLVRPDQHVAWAGAGLPPSTDELLDVVRGAVPPATG